ncbi:MBL fold metallo-hydrolase [Parapedobacter sp. ISTM3]|uniref:MBL fold metallo-hydrolase n=1 Tax=Parapedobacter sp. ISTM3 TaxID=2800130 RepID=UPI0019069BFF|nr:MBL fold metallo-hydrolase [Parapedobacter sp. ISTM3]MBK1440442.1 MBL fold metallo-hydrolase [Parapedobacter sp. ISTM3]
MHIHQFYDKGLAQASYAIISEGQMALIDPARNPKSYLDYAAEHQATIVAVIETHPHADFVSGHLELHQLTGATLYTSKLVGAEYPHVPFDDGDQLALGKLVLRAINTPGHSPDSICILLVDENDKPHAIFTGDTLFVGDVGRPDLRENVGNITAKAVALAKQLYRSTREKLMTLPADVLVYPAHGPGSLCGKNMGDDLTSSVGREIHHNYALQPMSEDEFVALIIEQQPFVPGYFEYDVMLNKKGAPAFEASIEAAPLLNSPAEISAGILIVDGRPQDQYRAGHLPGSINIPDGLRFETWLGTIVQPNEVFYLLGGDRQQLRTLLEKVAKIGYEQQVKGLLAITDGAAQTTPFNKEHFIDHQQDYTIVDIRNRHEVSSNPIFNESINIPLNELRSQAHLIPATRPIVVHCAGGYRSAIGSSILAATLADTVIQDMSTAILDFSPGK